MLYELTALLLRGLHTSDCFRRHISTSSAFQSATSKVDKR